MNGNGDEADKRSIKEAVLQQMKGKLDFRSVPNDPLTRSQLRREFGLVARHFCAMENPNLPGSAVDRIVEEVVDGMMSDAFGRGTGSEDQAGG